MTLRGLYRYGSALTRPVTKHSETVLRTSHGAKRPRLHLWGSWQPEWADLSARRRYASEQPPQAALGESQRGCRAFNGAMLDVVTFNQVLAKIRGYGRMLSAPTVQAGKLVPFNRTPSASRSLSSSPKGGAEGASRRGVPLNERLNPVGFRADAIRPYRASFFIFVWSAAYRSRRWRYIRRKSRTPHTCRIKFPVRSRTDSSSIGLFCGTFAYPPIKKAAGGILRQLLCYSILCRTGRN